MVRASERLFGSRQLMRHLLGISDMTVALRATVCQAPMLADDVSRLPQTTQQSHVPRKTSGGAVKNNPTSLASPRALALG
jgi:hypothetical protein